MKKHFKFIKSLIIIAIPIILQQLFLNIASLLDTLMVGQLDEINISGVYIATQIMFVVNLTIFGSIEGASVFFCQFYGKQDKDNLKKTFTFKVYSSLLFSTLAMLILFIFGRNLVSLFISNPAAIEVAINYLDVVAIGLLPFGITVAITSSMRESHNTILPMIGTLIGVLINFCINYIFIFGSFGAPKLGGVGAALGTTAEKFVQFLILIICCYIKKYDYCKGFFKNLKIEKKLFIAITKKSIPLVINETLWALGQTMLVFVFSQSSELSTVSLPIATTIYNLVFVVCLGIGNAITILVGNTVGRGHFKEAQTQSHISLIFSLSVGTILGILLALFAPTIVSFYTGVGYEAKELAKTLITFYGVYIILCALNNSIFFILRAGGKTGLVFVFDSLYGWILQIPFAFILLSVFNLEFIPLVIASYSIDIVKTIVGLVIILSKKWYKNLTILN